MPDLAIPHREQSLLDMYSKKILLSEYQALVSHIDFENEPFNVNLALSRLAMRNCDIVRGTDLFPRLKGLYSKQLVENVWTWSGAIADIRALSDAGITVCIVDDAALRLSSLKGIPRKMAYINIYVKPADFRKAEKVLRSKPDSTICIRRQLFNVQTIYPEPWESIVRYRDDSGFDLYIPDLELQFLLLCTNNAFELDGNSFNDSCLQWLMDIVDFVRNNPSMDWDRAYCLASVYNQRKIFDYALNIIGYRLPDICHPASNKMQGNETPDKEDVALARHSLYLQADACCRDFAVQQGPLAFLHRIMSRIKSNHYDFARFFPLKGGFDILFSSPGYYFRKYF